MNITELRYLVAIMECGSVSAAAKRLYAAQPNVSKALKNLEEEYHLCIFERSSTGMIPTEQGRHFIEQAERVLVIRPGPLVPYHPRPAPPPPQPTKPADPSRSSQMNAYPPFR